MSTTFQSILELDSYTKHPLKRNTIPPLPSTLDSTLPTSRIICGRGVGISCCAEMKIALIIHSPSKSLQVNLCWGGSFACFLIFPTQFPLYPLYRSLSSTARHLPIYHTYNFRASNRQNRTSFYFSPLVARTKSSSLHVDRYHYLFINSYRPISQTHISITQFAWVLIHNILG